MKRGWAWSMRRITSPIGMETSHVPKDVKPGGCFLGKRALCLSQASRLSYSRTTVEHTVFSRSEKTFNTSGQVVTPKQNFHLLRACALYSRDVLKAEIVYRLPTSSTTTTGSLLVGAQTLTLVLYSFLELWIRKWRMETIRRSNYSNGSLERILWRLGKKNCRRNWEVLIFNSDRELKLGISV